MESSSNNELNSIFSNYSSENLQNPDDALVAIRNKLFTILCSPMKDDFANEAYKWVSQLTMTVGDFSWICSDGHWKEQNDIKMFLCVTRLSLTEVELLIPLLERRLLEGSEPEIEDGKTVARSANSEDYDKLGNHLVIMENLIKVLVKDDKIAGEDADETTTNYLTTNMKDNDLSNLLDHLKKILLLLLRYLEYAHGNWNTIDKRHENEQFAAIMGCMRLVAMWLADDPVGFVEQTNKFLIDLFVWILFGEGHHNIDIFIVALHSVCTEDSVIVPVKEQSRLKDAMQRYLNYVTSEYNQSAKSSHQLKKQTKIYKLRCGMVRDILEAVKGK